MRVVAEYSFNNGAEIVREKSPHLLAEIEEVIDSIEAEDHRTKKSKEKTNLNSCRRLLEQKLRQRDPLPGNKVEVNRCDRR